MNRDVNFTDDTPDGQGTSFARLLARLTLAVRRVAAIDGNPIDAAEPEPLPELVSGIQDLLESDDPRVAHLQWEFLATLDRGIDALNYRLDRALGTTALRRPRRFPHH